jgi:hypothetical protein
MSIVPIALRAGASGPRTGLPPLLANPNLLSLAGYYHGASVGATAIAAVDQLVGGMDNKTINMKAGNRYLLAMQLTCEIDRAVSTSRTFVPTWGVKTSTGAFPALNAMSTFKGWTATPTSGCKMTLICDYLSASGEIQGSIIGTELYIPTADQVGIQFGCRVVDVNTHDSIDDWDCWAMVFEMPGIAP